MNRSGNWAFMKRMILVRPDGTTYLDRLRIVQTPWFAVYLHRIEAPDPGSDLHDHPWPFLSFILRGGYTEVRSPVCLYRNAPDERHLICGGSEQHFRTHTAPGLNRMKLDEAHTISTVFRVPTWTLMFVGRRSREWGFFVPGAGGWYAHEDYEALGRRELSRRIKG